MVKVALIGAGSVGFAQTLVKDILLEPSLAGCEVALMDISRERLERAAAVMKLLTEKLGSSPEFLVTTDLREAVRNADYVITTFRCGTLEHQRLEYEIPMKYKVDQVVSDTLGPGGVFRGLRTLKPLFEVLHAMEELCPGATLLNYVNPMSINTIALNKAAKTVRVIGLCHSVPFTAVQIAGYIGIPPEKLHYTAAGVNHQAFMLKLEADGVDMYPELRKAMENPEIYKRDRVRFEMLRYFGCFPTESSGHGSEYTPYFRKRKDILDQFCIDDWVMPGFEKDGYSRVANGISGASLQCCRNMQRINEENTEDLLNGRKEVSLESRRNEYAVRIIAAIEGNQVYSANLNVMNRGLIPGLPPECAVEVPCLVDGSGIMPCRVENYPEELAALNRDMINVQILAAEGALNCDRRKIFLAIAHDPNTSAVCSLAEIKSMTGELFDALADQIDPRFARCSG